MGCCCSKPNSPPTQSLVGTWVMNQQSIEFDAGNGYLRYGNKYTGKSFLHPICRLTISSQGWINFVQSKSKHSYTVIDGPALSWAQNKIKSIYDSQILLNFNEIEENKIIVNGHTLKKINI